MDCEGDFSADFGKGGAHLFPNQMGLRATGDLKLATAAWRVLVWNRIM